MIQIPQASYDITYTWNLKKKIQMNLYAKQKYLWLPKEIGGGKGMDWRFGVGTYMHTEVYGMTGQ